MNYTVTEKSLYNYGIIHPSGFIMTDSETNQIKTTGAFSYNGKTVRIGKFDADTSDGTKVPFPDKEWDELGYEIIYQLAISRVFTADEMEYLVACHPNAFMSYITDDDDA